MTTEEKKFYLNEEINDWRKRLSRAFLQVVNNKRKIRNLPLYSKDINIRLPSGPNADLFLLTLKIWCIKLHVTPEWIIEQILWLYRNRRKPDNNSEYLNLDLPAQFLTGTIARNYIENAMKIHFPNNENLKSMNIPVPRFINIEHLDFSLPEAVTEYQEAILKEREYFEKKTKPKQWKRNFRKI